MKKIEAIIRHYKLEDVKNALADIGVRGLTVSESKGYGRQGGRTETYRGVEYKVDFLPKLKLDIAVSDDMAIRTVDTITQAARTGEIGDGKIFVSNLHDVIRIRTGESGDTAL